MTIFWMTLSLFIHCKNSSPGTQEFVRAYLCSTGRAARELSQAELQEGLMAGFGARARRRHLQRAAADGSADEQSRDADSSSCCARGESVVASRQTAGGSPRQRGMPAHAFSGGHQWHGQQVCPTVRCSRL